MASYRSSCRTSSRALRASRPDLPQTSAASALTLGLRQPKNLKRRALEIAGIVSAVLASWFAFGYFSAQRACAHDPRFACSARPASRAVPIDDAKKSWAFYGSLQPGQSDYYSFIVATSADVPCSLLVDVRDAANRARPRAVIYGSQNVPLAEVAFNTPKAFYEPFSRETYLQSPVRALRLPPGRYTVVVSMAARERRQRYVLAIGAEERFSPLEIPYVIGAISRIRALRY